VGASRLSVKAASSTVMAVRFVLDAHFSTLQYPHNFDMQNTGFMSPLFRIRT